MQKSLQLALAGLAVISGISILPTSALSQDLELRVGPGGVGVYDRDRSERYERGPRGPRGCHPEEALDIARSEGFRRAQVVRVSSRSIVVEGFTRRGPDRMTFANRRGCPEI